MAATVALYRDRKRQIEVSAKGLFFANQSAVARVVTDQAQFGVTADADGSISGLELKRPERLKRLSNTGHAEGYAHS